MAEDWAPDREGRGRRTACVLAMSAGLSRSILHPEFSTEGQISRDASAARRAFCLRRPALNIALFMTS